MRKRRLHGRSGGMRGCPHGHTERAAGAQAGRGAGRRGGAGAGERPAVGRAVRDHALAGAADRPRGRVRACGPAWRASGPLRSAHPGVRRFPSACGTRSWRRDRGDVRRVRLARAARVRPHHPREPRRGQHSPTSSCAASPATAGRPSGGDRVRPAAAKASTSSARRVPASTSSAPRPCVSSQM